MKKIIGYFTLSLILSMIDKQYHNPTKLNLEELLFLFIHAIGFVGAAFAICMVFFVIADLFTKDKLDYTSVGLATLILTIVLILSNHFA